MRRKPSITSRCHHNDCDACNEWAPKAITNTRQWPIASPCTKISPTRGNHSQCASLQRYCRLTSVSNFFSLHPKYTLPPYVLSGTQSDYQNKHILNKTTIWLINISWNICCHFRPEYSQKSSQNNKQLCPLMFLFSSCSWGKSIILVSRFF